MPHFCHKCGNSETFSAIQYYIKRGSQDVSIDADGSIEDYGDEINEDVDVDDPTDIRCENCNIRVDNYDDGQILDMQIKHTNNTDGTWSEEELPEELQSKALLLDKI
jgi:hypothetical protein